MIFLSISVAAYVQKNIAHPQVVKSALAKKYPEALKVTWENEKGNFETIEWQMRGKET